MQNFQWRVVIILLAIFAVYTAETRAEETAILSFAGSILVVQVFLQIFGRLLDGPILVLSTDKR